MQSFEYRSVRYWSKEIGGTYWGPKKEFFNSRPIDGPAMRGGRAGGILSIPGPEVSPGVA